MESKSSASSRVQYIFQTLNECLARVWHVPDTYLLEYNG